MMYEDKIQEVEERLRDFQRATVNYIERRLYDDGQNRMLVADEVGLGKTWIAKGVIVRAYQRWSRMKHLSKEYFNIYYICSNQQLIAQNLKNINFTKDERCIISQINRISMLALKSTNDDVPIHIYALTPDTSFSQRSSQGIKDERYIIYAILEEYLPKEISRCHLSSLMKGSNSKIKWDDSVDNIRSWREKLLPGFSRDYISGLKETTVTREMLPTCYKYCCIDGENSLWDIILELVKKFDRRHKQEQIFNEIIGAMRKVMTDKCLQLMQANIYVMDEFQRYSQLLDAESESEQATIAQKVFGDKNAKVIMLSATPFKAFTNQYDEQHNEQHYKELKRVLKFLYEGIDIDWKSFETARGRMFSLMLQLRDSANKADILNEISNLKQIVEAVYSKVIVRTEKIIASNDPNAMIRNVEDRPLQVTKQEIDDFIKLDAAFQSVYVRQNEKAPSPIDYAKSAPYAMSFLREYKVGEKANENSVTLSKNAFIDLHEINRYNFPRDKHWPNGKLQILMKNMKRESKLLWCPPSIPYYPLAGAFKGQTNFTKTLVFSSWKLVPKMIATLVSYEAEKYSIGYIDGVKYFANKSVANKEDKNRKPSRRLVFTRDKNNFNTLLLAYPSRTLAEYIDPIELRMPGKNIKLVINKVKRDVDDFIKKGNINGIDETNINWAFPIFMDRVLSEDNSCWLDKNFAKIGQEESDTLLTTKYIPELIGYLSHNVMQPFNVKQKSSSRKIKGNLLQKKAQLMVKMSLGNPGVCAYRALKRYYTKEEDTKAVLVSAFQIGLAFIDFFNKPESIAIVDLQYPTKGLEYWQKVIQYCVDGNLQAVLDEYIFMLRNDYSKITEITKAICNVLSIRTTTLKVDDANSLSKKEIEDSDVQHSMRCHYAAAFGVNAKSSQGGVVRSKSIREAFNSPFRPFVLATTSIGQEGLDFHWYCRRIIHWNLPNSPIDFEQREGRINRYRGKVIRQRVANKYARETFISWDELFKRAEAELETAKFKCDIVPNWHIDSNDVSIERLVPLYQFSQDIQRYSDMLHVLGLYRLTFGQPRQDELVEAIDCALTDEQKDELLINLCPLKRNSDKK